MKTDQKLLNGKVHEQFKNVQQLLWNENPCLGSRNIHIAAGRSYVKQKEYSSLHECGTKRFTVYVALKHVESRSVLQPVGQSTDTMTHC